MKKTTKDNVIDLTGYRARKQVSALDETQMALLFFFAFAGMGLFMIVMSPFILCAAIVQFVWRLSGRVLRWIS